MKSSWFIFGTVLLCVAAVATADTPAELHNLGYVVVSPSGPTDGGDYGPDTPGTQTSGFQEAFTFARAQNKEVYIIGGGIQGDQANPVVYTLNAPLAIPWGQDWRCDGGNYVMNFTLTSGPCLSFDSQMNCLFRFGVVSAPNLQSGPIVKIAPTNIGPDNFKICTSSTFNFTAIIGPGGPNLAGHGTGLLLDASIASIIFGKVFVGEIRACETGLLLDQGGITNNVIECPRIRLCNTALAVNSGSYNHIIAAFDPNTVAGARVGANLVGGNQNNYRLTWADDFASGTTLIFGAAARDNFIYTPGLPAGTFTNNASTPTNRIIPLKSLGFGITTPAFPASGNFVTNTTSYAVAITLLTRGQTLSHTIRDAYGNSRVIQGYLYPGQIFLLEPGEAISFAYLTAPTWTWRALR
jgi:hypothetical protein